MWHCAVIQKDPGTKCTRRRQQAHKEPRMHAETHAEAQVCTQRAALSQQFSGSEALHPGQSTQMYICSEL